MNAGCINGIWPLFSDNTTLGWSQGYHTHVFDDITYYMPNNFPGAQHTGTCPNHAVPFPAPPPPPPSPPSPPPLPIEVGAVINVDAYTDNTCTTKNLDAYWRGDGSRGPAYQYIITFIDKNEFVKDGGNGISCFASMHNPSYNVTVSDLTPLAQNGKVFKFYKQWNITYKGVWYRDYTCTNYSVPPPDTPPGDYRNWAMPNLPGLEPGNEILIHDRINNASLGECITLNASDIPDPRSRFGWPWNGTYYQEVYMKVTSFAKLDLIGIPSSSVAVQMQSSAPTAYSTPYFAGYNVPIPPPPPPSPSTSDGLDIPSTIALVASGVVIGVVAIGSLVYWIVRASRDARGTVSVKSPLSVDAVPLIDLRARMS